MEGDGEACTEAGAEEEAPGEFGEDGEGGGGFGEGAEGAVGPAAEEVAWGLEEEQGEGDERDEGPAAEPSAEDDGHGEAA